MPVSRERWHSNDNPGMFLPLIRAISSFFFTSMVSFALARSESSSLTKAVKVNVKFW